MEAVCEICEAQGKRRWICAACRKERVRTIAAAAEQAVGERRAADERVDAAAAALSGLVRRRRHLLWKRECVDALRRMRLGLREEVESQRRDAVSMRALWPCAANCCLTPSADCLR